MDAKKEIMGIGNWLKETYPGKTMVIGISGGVDSAVMSAICRDQNIPVIGVVMPCYGGDTSRSSVLGLRHCENRNIKMLYVNLQSAYDALRETIHTDINTKMIFKTDDKQRDKRLADGNLQSRLRMCTLYYIANAHNGIVCGTDNAAENFMGYFTKYGDGGVDCNPLEEYTKGEVYELARELNISEEIINRPPTADLFEDKETDEEELGVTYNDIDAFIKNGKTCGDEKKDEIIIQHHMNSQHKRNVVPCYVREEEPMFRIITKLNEGE